LVGEDDGLAVALTHWIATMADWLGSENACLAMHQAPGRVGRGCFGGLGVGVRVGMASWLRATVVRTANSGGRVVGDY
jgi:hypothetical protein